MGSGTSSGRTSSGGVARQATSPVTTSSIKDAITNLKSPSGGLNSSAIDSAAEEIDRIAPGVRLEVQATSNSNELDYYYKDESGNWITSHVSNGSLERQSQVQDARTVVLNVVQSGILNHPNRLRVINAH